MTIGTDYLVTYGIAVDSTGKVDIAGQAYVNSTLPAGANSYNATPPSSGWAGFLVQISADGSATPYATYIYGNSNCYSTGVAVDSSGNAYISGYGYGAGFPTTAGAYQAATANTNYTGFVAKFNPTAASGAASLVYSTLLGSPTGATYLYGIALDGSNNAYVSGNAPSGFPVTNGAFQYTGYDSGDSATGSPRTVTLTIMLSRRVPQLALILPVSVSPRRTSGQLAPPNYSV